MNYLLNKWFMRDRHTGVTNNKSMNRKDGPNYNGV